MDGDTSTPNADAALPPYEAWPARRTQSTDGKLEQQLPTAMDVDSTTERGSRAPSAFSVDDYEVAKALTSLQEGATFPLRKHVLFNSKFVTGTPSGPLHPSTMPHANPQLSNESQPQPLLKLFISQHPLMASAINNSLSAYSSSKSYSPSFRVGAEFLERNIGTPMANTVNTASRISGVETGVRWWLQRNDSGNSNPATPSGSSEKIQTHSNKRRRESEGADSIPSAPPVHRARGFSESSQAESLPPYDDRRSPAYEEHYTPSSTERAPSRSSQTPCRTPIQQSWSTRVAIHTSGLGVAMSEESLRSLRYCLTWLKWANTHLNTVLSSLQAVLEEWERSQRSQQQDPHGDGDDDGDNDTGMQGVIATSASGQAKQTQPQTRDQATIASHLQALKNECVRTLKTALDVVSKYAGGALPENARWLVRCHLTSLPARFRLASASSRSSSVVSMSKAGGTGESGGTNRDEEAQTTLPEAVTGAQRVIVLAREGLDMMAQ
ncbi:MAG: hypothetical protein LQ340_007415, partial [Diploschistes diacapsis]